jgi:hypothetical protein
MKKMQERPDNVTRAIGLGQSPSDTAFEQVARCAFTQVPVIEYVTWSVPLPLSDDQLESTFGEEIDVLTSSKSVEGVASVDSSFVVNGILQTSMFVVGFGVHIFGEPLSFSQIGNSAPVGAAPNSAPPVSPDAFTLNDLNNGALGPTSGIVPAQMEWGFADWMAGWHLINAYQFNWRVMQRLYLIQELAADVSYFGPFAEGVAAGTSDATVQQYARQINDQYTALAATSRFIPVSHRRVGSVNTGPTTYAAHGNIGVFHPTRDYDLAPATFGGIRNQGTTGVQTPFRKLNRPVLLPQGIPIGMTLNAQDSYHRAQMLRYMSISEGAGTNAVATVQIDASYSGYSTAAGGITATAAPALELTLDTASQQFAVQQINTDRALYKGGVMKLSIQIKGFEVVGPWSQYFSSRTPTVQQFVDMPANSSAIAGLPSGR